MDRRQENGRLKRKKMKTRSRLPKIKRKNNLGPYIITKITYHNKNHRKLWTTTPKIMYCQKQNRSLDIHKNIDIDSEDGQRYETLISRVQTER